MRTAPDDEDSPHDIVVHLDSLLAARDLTLTELADRVGVTIANLSILKNGRARAVRFSTLTALCRELDCTPGDLLGYRPRERGDEGTTRRASNPSIVSLRMEIRPIDPRDTGWEVPHPVFRVYFWDRHYTSYEYEVTGADVHEVIEWAEGKAGHQLTYVLYALVDRGEGVDGVDRLGLIQLAGRDPMWDEDHGVVRPSP